MTPGPSPTIVFLHGAWMGPWIWDDVISELSDVETATVDYPSTGSDPATLGSLDDDVAALMACVDGAAGPVVIVAHSYAGAIATAAPLGPGVEKIIYLAAFMFDEGNNFATQNGAGDPPPWWTIHDAATGPYITVDPAAARDAFFGDLPDGQAVEAAGRLRCSSMAAQISPLPRASWRDHESVYVICENDRGLPPALQEAMAVQADRTIRLASSHTPSLSMPARLARLIRDELEL